MKEVKINDLQLLKYCEEKIAGKELVDFPDKFPSHRCVCFGDYGVDGEPLWVVVLYDFKEGHDCLMDLTLNIKGMLTPSLFKMMGRVVFDYIFNQAKLVRCSSQVRISHESSIRITKAWGMKEEGRRRLGFKHPYFEDAIIFGMLKTECPWI
jgi:hypothetical protein